MSNILSIRFTIEGWPTTYYDFNVKGKVLKYSYTDEKAKLNKEKYNITNDFYDKVEEITKDWSKEYENYCVQDGIHWSLTITYKDGNKRTSEGLNAYPDNYDKLIEFLESIDNDK